MSTTQSTNNEIKKLQEKIEQKENQLHSIQQIGKSLSSVLNRDKLLILIMDEVTRLMIAERGTLFLVDSEKGELWSKIAQKAEIKEIRLKIGVGIAGYVAKTGETINIKDAYQDDRFDPSTDKKTGYKTKSILCMPIREPVKEENKKGEIIGVLQILNKIDGVFIEEDEELLTSLASQISISLVNSRLYSILENKVNELNLLFDLEKELSGAYEQNELLQKLLLIISKILNTKYAILILSDKTGKGYPFRWGINLDNEKIRKASLNLEKGIWHSLISKGQVYISNEIDDNTVLIAKELSVGVDNLLSAPLISDGRVIGAMVFINKKQEKSYFSKNDERIIISAAGQLARGVVNYWMKEEKMNEDRLATIGNMMSAIVHDLRTPMNNIYGFVDLMCEEEDQESRTEFAEIVNQQIKILTNMTTDVLDFAKGKSNVLLRKYPVDKLIKEFVRFFENDVKNRGYIFDWNIDVTAMIYVDTDKLKRVFMNIMKNSLEAMKKGGTFTLKASEVNGEIEFLLSDTGKGIPEEIKDKLFDSFVTSG
ncbi:MAG: GAF domain-containing sensor histidine kinase, partial [Calditrichia bacterium]|nr:GAF domain-containing sensor histidine kinase [Calditrichia bacterium]